MPDRPYCPSRRAWIVLCALLLIAAAAPVRAQNALDRLRARGELAIATDATYPPFELRENGKLKGFDIDLGNELGRQLGLKIRWVPMEWTAVFGALETGKVDLIMSGVTITDERKKGNAFTRPYFLSGQVIARRKGDLRIRTLEDLKGKTVSVQDATTGMFAVQKIGVPKERILRFDTLQDGLLDLRNGKADATVADLPALKAILRKGYDDLELAGGVFVRENVGIVARRNDLELVAALNDAIEAVLVDGRYARIYREWIQEPLTTADIAGLYAAREVGTLAAERAPAPDKATGGSSSSSSASASTPAPGATLALRWSLLPRVLPQLLVGARMTLYITALTLLIGLPLGLLIALLRVAHFAPLKLIGTIYVEVVRGTPLLMQIYVIYFVLPALHIDLPNLWAAVAALSLNSAAYIAEIFRSGIESIDSGQMEAARSLGMDYRGAMRWVILPQTVRRVLPPLTNEGAALLKETSLVSVVALAELMRVTKEIVITSGSPTTIYLAVALLYLAMTLPLTALVRRLERKWRPISRTMAEDAGRSTP